jgi:Flp pilus assembly pilin Flp
MKKHILKLRRRIKNELGGSLVEYALILALIGVAALSVLRGVGKNVNTKLGSVNSNLSASGRGGNGGGNNGGGGRGGNH